MLLVKLVIFEVLNVLSFVASLFGIYYYFKMDKRSAKDRFFSKTMSGSLALYHLAYIARALLFYVVDPMTNTTRTFVAIDLVCGVFSRAFSTTAILSFMGNILPMWTSIMQLQYAKTSTNGSFVLNRMESLRQATIYVAVALLVLTFATFAAIPAYQVGLHLTYYPQSIGLLYAVIGLGYMNVTLAIDLKSTKLSSKSSRKAILRLMTVNALIFSYCLFYFCVTSLKYYRSMPQDFTAEEYEKVRGSYVDLELFLTPIFYFVSTVGFFVQFILLTGPTARTAIRSLFKGNAGDATIKSLKTQSIETGESSKPSETDWNKTDIAK